MTEPSKRPGTNRRVAIVDDHPLIRRGLIDLLNDEVGFTASGQAGSTSEALALLGLDPPDILLLDLCLDGGSGLELVKQVRARFPAVAILVYSMHDETLYAERALEAGARGYVQKHSPVDELLDALRDVAAGKIHISRQMTDKLLQQRVSTGADVGTSIAKRLSDRELQVFEYLGNGRTTREIATELNISVKTVERHCENIKDKLQVENRTQLLQRAVHWILDQA
jgi:DNA-binding NarL/FixJ family response regulator